MMKNLLALAIFGCAISAARPAIADALPPRSSVFGDGVFSRSVLSDNVLGDSALGSEAKYRAATLDEATAAVNRWLEKAGLADDLRQKVAQLWKADLADPTGPRLLQRLGETFALVDARARQLVAVVAKSHDRKDLPSLAWLADPKLDPLLRDNLRLLVGRWLCQEKLYDESLAVLRDVKPEDVVDPASLFFYRSVACHRLLVKKEGLESIHSLLEDVGDSPQRYLSLAASMQRDLEALKSGSLDDISRRMEDLERRLGLWRAGKVVRNKEDEIVSLLDKLIDALQEQQPNSPAAASPGGERNNRTQPSGGQGPTAKGEVHPRDAQGSRWGDLPPKDRQAALQQLGKDFPAHYRAAIEQYFRRVASDTKPQP